MATDAAMEKSVEELMKKLENGVSTEEEDLVLLKGANEYLKRAKNRKAKEVERLKRNAEKARKSKSEEYEEIIEKLRRCADDFMEKRAMHYDVCREIHKARVASGETKEAWCWQGYPKFHPSTPIAVSTWIKDLEERNK